MQKNGTPEPLHARALVVAGEAYEIIGFVLAPHFLMAGIKRQSDRAVIKPVARGIAPAVCGFEPFSATHMRHLVRPIQELAQFPAPHRAFSIALALEMGAAVFAQQAGKALAADFQHPTK